LHDIKRYFLIVVESLETFSADGGKMDENILAIFLFDKSKTFGFIEPFHFTRSHLKTLLTAKMKKQRLRQRFNNAAATKKAGKAKPPLPTDAV